MKNSFSHRNLIHLLVSYPALQPPSSTTFKCYSRKRLKTVESPDVESDLIVVGETDRVEFDSNEEECKRVAQSGCQSVFLLNLLFFALTVNLSYLLAIRNKRTGNVTLLPTGKTPHVLRHTVKALKSLPSSTAPSKVVYQAAKNTLGETFGTKKQKASIKAQERNKIDVGAMEGVIGYVMDSIDKGAENLLTAGALSDLLCLALPIYFSEGAKEVADSNRLIPPYSATAMDPADIYPLHSIIPEAEWKALSISPFDAAQTLKDKCALLPFRKSNYLYQHMKGLAESEAKIRKKHL